MRLSDERLDFLLKLYAPTVVPPCRVCGGDMGIGKIGGGGPTVWACNHAFDAGHNREAWDHYGKSEFVDRRQGGNGEVCELIAEVRALRECEKALRDLRECSNPFLTFGEREVHRRRVAADRALERLEVLGASTQTES